MAVLFAATTMDTGMRLLRFVVQEIGATVKVRITKVPATLIVVVVGLGLTFSQGLAGDGQRRVPSDVPPGDRRGVTSPP